MQISTDVDKVVDDIQIATELEPSFSYTLLWIILLTVLLIILILFFFVIKKRKKKQIVIVKPSDPQSIKNKYLKELNALEKLVDDNKIDIRNSYQKLSSIIRRFIHEMTGLEVTTLTLEDVKKINMPVLANLMETYYKPEFAYKSIGDIKQDIMNARGVMTSWK